ncbi:hypothetical protein BC826DRAFT_716602 [Russula brevipes]|nr:hypothetical protein BC826DRAFT_716602 [Russula brevipes]
MIRIYAARDFIQPPLGGSSSAIRAVTATIVVTRSPPPHLRRPERRVRAQTPSPSHAPKKPREARRAPEKSSRRPAPRHPRHRRRRRRQVGRVRPRAHHRAPGGARA